jgi:hypothetical protein
LAAASLKMPLGVVLVLAGSFLHSLMSVSTRPCSYPLCRPKLSLS